MIRCAGIFSMFIIQNDARHTFSLALVLSIVVRVVTVLRFRNLRKRESRTIVQAVLHYGQNER
jgi:hypothetical protein